MFEELKQINLKKLMLQQKNKPTMNEKFLDEESTLGNKFT